MVNPRVAHYVFVPVLVLEGLMVVVGQDDRVFIISVLGYLPPQIQKTKPITLKTVSFFLWKVGDVCRQTERLIELIRLVARLLGCFLFSSHFLGSVDERFNYSSWIATRLQQVKFS